MGKLRLISDAWGAGGLQEDGRDSIDGHPSGNPLAGVCTMYVTKLPKYERMRESRNVLALQKLYVGTSDSRVASESIMRFVGVVCCYQMIYLTR